MSQRAVEAVLGRLITDVEFRARFFAEPGIACGESDVVLTVRETAALLRVDVQALHDLAATLDPKIVRAALVAQVRRLGGTKSKEVRAERIVSEPAPGLRRE